VKTERKVLTLEEILEGFVYDSEEGKGLYGLGGRLQIQPEYQRNYVYAEKKMDEAVVQSVFKGYPLGVLYFNKTANGNLEVLDGQQRITSLGRFYTGKLGARDENRNEQYFTSISPEKRRKFLETEILVYECEGQEDEIKDWFRTINIAGVQLNSQEILNSVYSGPFVTRGKEVFSNKANSKIQRWKSYVSGSVSSQDYWECALEWISGGKAEIDDYMSKNRNSSSIEEVQNHFNTVIDWADATFKDVFDEMQGLEWGKLFNEYGRNEYDPEKLSQQVKALHGDPFIKRKKGIWEYVLGGEKNVKLLELRVFDDVTKAEAYATQTSKAQAEGSSNCPLCSLGKSSNSQRIWKLSEMEADHVTPWSKEGKTDRSNCEVLCKTHNRIKSDH